MVRAIHFLFLVSVLGLAACEWDVDYSRKKFRCVEYKECPEGLVCSVSGWCVEDPCEGTSCSGSGSCGVLGGLPFCKCDPGFHPSGTECVANNPDDVCDGVSCDEHGACSSDGDGNPYCECESSYQDFGLHCFAPDCQYQDCTGKPNSHCDFIDSTQVGCVCDPGYAPDLDDTACEDNRRDLLMHLDDTSFADDCGGHAVTAHGDVAITTFGVPMSFAGAATFDGTGDYLGVQNSSAWNFGDGDFTIEARVQAGCGMTEGDYNLVIGRGSDVNNYWALGVGRQTASMYGRFGFHVVSGGASVLTLEYEEYGSFQCGMWQHVTVQRYGTTVRLDINGILGGQQTVTSMTMPSASLPLNIGGGSTAIAPDFSGAIDEVRITKGNARWDGGSPMLYETPYACDSVGD